MGKGDNHTDVLFRERLKNYEATPPEGAWNNISSTLSSDRRRRRTLFYWRAAASVAVVAGIGAAILLVGPPSEEPLAEEHEISTPLEQSPDATPVISEPQETEAAGNVPLRTGEAPAVMASDDASSTIAVADRAGIQGSPGPLNRISPIHSPDLLDANPPSGMLLGMAVPGKPGSKFTGVQEDHPDLPETGEEEKHASGIWTLGTHAAPLYSYRSLTGGSGSTLSASYYDQVEDGLLAYAGGIHVNYSPMKRLSFQSGLYYSKMGITVGDALYKKSGSALGAGWNPGLLAFSNSSGNIKTGTNTQGDGLFETFSQRDQSPVITEASNLITLPSTVGEIIQEFEYIELPLIIRYRVVDRKIGFNLLGGISTNILIGSDTYVRQDGVKEFLGTTGSLKTVNYASVMGVGLNYALGSNLNLSVEPTFRYYLNSINAATVLNSHPYSFGIFTGLSYSF